MSSATAMPPGDRATLERLLKVAASHTNQGDAVADFLLSWWNPTSCGGIGPAKLWGLDASIARDCVLLFAWVAQNQHYPDELGYEPQFSALVRQHRPSLS